MSDLVQTVTVGFQDPVNSTDLVNRMLTGIILPKVYRGGAVSAEGTNSWYVAPLVAIVKSQDATWASVKRSQARVEFLAQTGQTYAAIVACHDTKYIVIRWQSSDTYPAKDYPAGLATIVGEVDTPLENDVVIARIVNGAPDYGGTTAASGSGMAVQSKVTLDNAIHEIPGNFVSPYSYDQSIPMSSDGYAYTQINTTITPLSVSNRLRVRAVVNYGHEGPTIQMAFVSLFVGSAASAFAAGRGFGGNQVVGGSFGSVEAYGEIAVTSLSSITINARVAATGQIWINRGAYAAGSLFGGVAPSRLEIFEVTP